MFERSLFPRVYEQTRKYLTKVREKVREKEKRNREGKDEGERKFVIVWRFTIFIWYTYKPLGREKKGGEKEDRQRERVRERKRTKRKYVSCI